jgi:DNA mismatch repair ATPase MutS
VLQTTKAVTRCTEKQIQELCAQILSAKTDAAKVQVLSALRNALREHVRMARRSLRFQAETLALLEAVARSSGKPGKDENPDQTTNVV